ncbi:MAG TPA: hypothetical protein VIW67_22670, partial [Terriglobales bacterium]
RTKRSADVATEMNRLRRALKTYYEDEGANDPIVIVLPNRAVNPGNGARAQQWIVAELRKDGHKRIADHASGLEMNFRRPSTKTALTTLVCMTLGAVAYFSINMLILPQRPQFGRLDGTVLRIMDANGKELWSKSFPEGFGPDWYYAQGLTSRIWFGDLDGTGNTSVLFAYSSAANPQRSSVLICYSNRGKEKWRWTPGRDLPELGGSPATFKTFAFGVLKATDKQSARVLVSSAHDTWWPNQIAVLDASGKVISEYWHSGRLDSMALGDLDGDGKEEIIAAGINNGYHQATLVALDADHVTGASTEIQPDFQIHNMGAAQEKVRLLFARSDMNQALYPYNQAINPLVEKGIIRIIVRECMTPPGCQVFYELDKDFRLINVYAAEDFRSSHGRFYQNGAKAHNLSAAEETGFEKIRCLIGCKSEFVPVREVDFQAAR